MNEKENTFRILKEETPLVKSLWCRFGIHNWTMYGEPVEGVYERTLWISKHKALIQYRYCCNCNKINRGITLIGSAYH